MDDELHFAWFETLLGREAHRPLPDVAADALVAGYDAPALQELAGLDRMERQEARDLLTAAMRELGEPVPPDGASEWQRVRPALDPDVVANLEAGLALVQADLDATVPQIGTLTLVPLNRWEMLVALPSGEYHNGGRKCGGNDLPTAIASIAEVTQVCLIEVDRVIWPRCAQHDRMLDISRTVPAWECADGGGHFVALIGELRGDG